MTTKCRDSIQVSATQRNRRKRNDIRKYLIPASQLSRYIFTGLLSLQTGGTRVSFLTTMDCLRLKAIHNNQIWGMIVPCSHDHSGKQHPYSTLALPPSPEASQGSEPRWQNRPQKTRLWGYSTWRSPNWAASFPGPGGGWRSGQGQPCTYSLPWRTPPPPPCPARPFSTPAPCAPLRRTRGAEPFRKFTAILGCG